MGVGLGIGFSHRSGWGEEAADGADIFGVAAAFFPGAFDLFVELPRDETFA